ncbi:MAG: ABC transporter permease [Mycoplasma sp.]|nr:ABC transporter permease [Mycoplasma sp.]
MSATLKLLNAYFWKTAYGPILAFIFPTLLLGILGNVMRIEYVLPGIIGITTLFIAVQSMPLGLMEMKNSTLFKYIGSSPIDSRKFTSATILYYIFINFIAIVLLIFTGSIIFYNKVFISNGLYSGIFSLFGMFSFICANLLHIFLALAVGILIATLSKTPQQALTIALIIIIPSMFLSGMVITVDIIAQSKSMQWISRLIPFRYTTGNIIVASTPSSQIGSLMTMLSLENKKLIFNIIGEVTSKNHIKLFDPTKQVGLIITQDGSSFWQTSDITLSRIGLTNEYILKPKDGSFAINVYDMKRFFYENQDLWGKAKGIWFQSGDSTLFKTIFLKDNALVGSDNNIFNWMGAFGVRKIPEVDAIKSFMKTFFKGESNDPNRFIYIWEHFIQKGDFSFLELFMKQNVVLYTLAERVLNLCIPVISSLILIWWSMKKFAWSAR